MPFRTVPDRQSEPGSTLGRSLAQRAYETIRRMILTRQVRGGDILSEERLANDLATSRTPIREALLLLKSEGLIEKHANQPFRVRVVKSQEFFQSMRVRELLEGEAAWLAAGKMSATVLDEIEREFRRMHVATDFAIDEHWRMDSRLHLGIADASGNAVLAQVIRDLRVTTYLYEFAHLPAQHPRNLDGQLAIIDAIRRGDGEAARDGMQAHIREIARMTLAMISEA